MPGTTKSAMSFGATGTRKVFSPVYRSGTFGWGFNADDFKRRNLGDIDKDGDFTTDELFDLR
jgi:hypothetical protein